MQQPSSKVNDAKNKEAQIEEVDMAQQTSIEEVLPENTEVMEPILVENPNRFVLFPISTMIYGQSIKNKKHVFGQLKKSTFHQFSRLERKT